MDIIICIFCNAEVNTHEVSNGTVEVNGNLLAEFFLKVFFYCLAFTEIHKIVYI